MWAYAVTAQIFGGTPYYHRNGQSYGLQIWPVHLQGPSKQKSMPIKCFGEKVAWAYPGTAQIFGVPPIIPGMGKASNFKFCMHIYNLNRNKSPLKIQGKVAVCIVRESPIFFRAPICRAHHVVSFLVLNLCCVFSVSFY